MRCGAAHRLKCLEPGGGIVLESRIRKAEVFLFANFKGGAAKPPAFSIWYLVFGMFSVLGFRVDWGKEAKRAKW